MIKHLKIKNFVLIEEAEFEFSNNLNILIGETGGGKSLVFRAISQLLGQRAQSSYIQKTKEYYEISAVFSNDEHIKKVLLEQGIEIYDNLYISRKYTLNGTNKITVNGELISLNRLKEITSEIADIVLQKENNQAIETAQLFNYLNIDHKVHYTYLENLEEYRQLKKLVYNLQKQKNNQEEELLIINHRLSSFKGIDFKVDFDKATNTIRNAEDAIANLNKYRKISHGIDQALLDLQFEKGIDSDIDERLYEIKDQLENLSFDVSKKLASDISENEINFLKDQLSIAKKLARQFDCELYQLEEIYDNLNATKDGLDSLDIDLVNAENKLSKKSAVMDKLWRDLLAMMQHNANALEAKINSLFVNVEMPKARVKYEFASTDDYNLYGKCEINLLIDANGLGKFGNVNEHASGGEFSRLLLILKTLDKANEKRLLMFDEIDTGISGYTAQKMIKLIQEIANKNQIILITHLAQSAAAADVMYEITKQDGISSSNAITETEMPKVIAKLLSGSEITKEAINQANILIKEVKNV